MCHEAFSIDPCVDELMKSSISLRLTLIATATDWFFLESYIVNRNRKNVHIVKIYCIHVSQSLYQHTWHVSYLFQKHAALSFLKNNVLNRERSVTPKTLLTNLFLMHLTVFRCFQRVEKGCIGNKWVRRVRFLLQG